MGDYINESSSHADLQKKIAQTLVFFDVESTGLPFSVGKKNVQITELSLIAVDRTEFETSKNIRVVNKLSLAIKPRSRISIGAVQMTGLCNTSLQFQEHFSPMTAHLLQLFFQRLNQPVCLLAHNGRRFDFPVLQAELQSIGAKLSDSLYCADTIEAFRTLLRKELPETDTSVSGIDIESCVHHPEITLLSPEGLSGSAQHLTSARDASYKDKKYSAQYYEVNTLTDDHIGELLCQETEIFDNFISKDETVDLSKVPHVISTNSNYSNRDYVLYSSADGVFDPSSSQQGEKTPLNKTGDIPVTPAKCVSSSLEQITPDKIEKNHSSARRKLFNGKDMVADGQSLKYRKNGNREKKMSFSLQNLYRHLFKCDVPQAHFAEGDCIALMKISSELKGFLPWVDEHMILFDNVKPLW